MIQPTHDDLWRLAAAEHRAPAPDDYGAADDELGMDDDTRAADLADRGVTVRSGVRNRGPRSTGAI